MLGTVLSYNEQKGLGIVETLDGEVYQFDYTCITDGCIPYKGMAAYFEVTELGRARGRAQSISRTLPLFTWGNLAVLLFAFAISACSVEGPASSQGVSGLIGKDGQDATPVTVVKLCPGTTTYPNVFIEVALCIQGSLYGVYSLNNGFLVELVPGNYTSNALGSACNLTVEANCVITH